MQLKKICLLAALATILFTGCSKTSTTPVSPPVANFVFSGAGGFAPATVTFSNTSTNAVSYSWDFGDGTTSTSSNPSHVYLRPGSYSVTLTASSSSSTVTTTKTVNIVASSVKIVGVKVTAMPFIDPSCGCGWDPTSGPDVYFDLTDFGGTILASGNVFNDVTPANLPLTWVFSTPYQISNLNAIFKVQVYDSDAPLSPAFIGGYFITFSNYAPSYPTTITLQNSSSSLVEVLTVQWQ